jgi:hypothetical protein
MAIPAEAFSSAKAYLSYLLFCPGQGGWRVGEWQRGGISGNWVSVVDFEHELAPSHIVLGPSAPLSDTEIDAWMRRYGEPVLR